MALVVREVMTLALTEASLVEVVEEGAVAAVEVASTSGGSSCCYRYCCSLKRREVKAYRHHDIGRKIHPTMERKKELIGRKV